MSEKKKIQTPQAEEAAKMIPASTELPADVNAKVEFFRKEGRPISRALALRIIVTEWAKTQPAPVAAT